MPIIRCLILAFSLMSFGEPYSTKNLYLSLNIHGGKELILSDDSHWEVFPEDIAVSKFWISPFPLTITYGDADEYPFILTNTLSSVAIKAKPL